MNVFRRIKERKAENRGQKLREKIIVILVKRNTLNIDYAIKDTEKIMQYLGY